VNQVEHPGNEPLTTELVNGGHHRLADDMNSDKIGAGHIFFLPAFF